MKIAYLVGGCITAGTAMTVLGFEIVHTLAKFAQQYQMAVLRHFIGL